MDDDPSTLTLIQTVLQPHSYDVLTANSGEAALAVLLKHRVDAILIDLLMPGMNSFEVAGRIRESEDLSNIPPFVLTGQELTVGQREALARYAQRILGNADRWDQQLSHEIDAAVKARPGFRATSKDNA